MNEEALNDHLPRRCDLASRSLRTLARMPDEWTESAPSVRGQASRVPAGARFGVIE